VVVRQFFCIELCTVKLSLIRIGLNRVLLYINGPLMVYFWATIVQLYSLPFRLLLGLCVLNLVGGYNNISNNINEQ